MARITVYVDDDLYRQLRSIPSGTFNLSRLVQDAFWKRIKEIDEKRREEQGR